MLKEIYDNPILLTDFYNLNHFFLKKNLDYEVSHIYNRSRSMILYGFNERARQIFDVKIEVDMVMEAEDLSKKMGLKNFPTEMWMRISEKFKGHLPIRVQALPDGMWIPKGTPFAQIQNTEEGFGELVTWFEATLLHIAFASGCATRSFEIKKYLDLKNLPTHRVHSFGFRGHNSTENAYYGGTAWNLFLTGTDDFHTAKHTIPEKISSIPATAHKTIQQFDNEYEAYTHSIEQTSSHGESMLSLVIDTYDPERFIKDYSVKLATLAKQKGVKLIFRPDSGDVFEQSVRLYHLMNQNDLVENTGIIIGEGITLDKIKKYDHLFELQKIPLGYVNFGMGAGFFKDIDRDWTGLAMKTCFSNGKPRMKFSATPIKRSIPDVVNIVREDGNLVVDYTRDGLYEDVYYFDERSSRPKTWVQSWSEIQQIALKQTGHQQEIIYSPLVNQKIKEFEDEYLVSD